LAYDLSGVGSSGTPVVLVHGWCCDRTYLAPQHEHLAASRAVAALDLRGHGRSEATDAAGFTIGDFADDVATVAASAGLDQPVVIGHSLGALVALECAARGFARAAVMLDPAPILDERAKGQALLWASAAAEDTDGTWRRRFAERVMLPTDRVRRDEIIDGMALTDVSVAGAAMRGVGEYDAAAALAQIQVPLLILSAARPEDLGPVRALCPTVVTGQTVGAGHFNQLEVPEQVNLMIDRFLTLAGL
jgi:pimeloyl-ACP methyl ester carboxylesterase